MDKPNQSAGSVIKAQNHDPTAQRPLRVWPGVALGILMLVLRLVVPAVDPDAAAIGILGGTACSLLVVAWWLLFSRARWFERLGVVLLMAVAFFATLPLVHMSI